MSTPLLSANDPLTVVLYLRQRAVKSWSNYFSASNTSVNYHFRVGEYSGQTYGFPDPVDTDVAVTPYNTWRVLSFVINGSNSKLYINGSLVWTGTVADQAGATQFFLAVNGGVTGNIDLAESIIYSKAISQTEVTGIQKYFQSYYNL